MDDSGSTTTVVKKVVCGKDTYSEARTVHTFLWCTGRDATLSGAMNDLPPSNHKLDHLRSRDFLRKYGVCPIQIPLS